MKTEDRNFGIAHLDSMFVEAFLTLHEKGYVTDRLCMIQGCNFYDEYKELPMDFITFTGIVELPSVPVGFNLAHILDDECSLLFYRYEDNLSREQVLNKKTELAAALLFWVLQIPSNDTEDIGW